ncbi:hypothetical protein LMG22931_05600 [Paraburkholderia nemoris]|nr:hypothetical protein LMG22931_05600 [Paraburkholderia nemoris]
MNVQDWMELNQADRQYLPRESEKACFRWEWC